MNTDFGPKDLDDEDEEYPWEEVEDDLDNMKARHPGHTEESYRAGKFLGVDFPYVPGDPFF